MDRIDTLLRELEGAAGSAERGAILNALTYAHASKWIDTAAFHRAQKMLHVGAFLSAALTLVPEGWTVMHAGQNPVSGTWYWGLHKQAEAGVNNGFCQQVGSRELFNSDHHTTNPALALCIAALKARRGA